jgi:hypothetical protein
MAGTNKYIGLGTMINLTYVEDSNLFVRNGNIGGVLSGHREGIRLVEGQHFREGHSVVPAKSRII